MEQPVWLIFGVIAVLIALGIVVSIVNINHSAAKEYEVKDTLNKLMTQCNFVCGTTAGNLLSIKAKLPAETILYTNGNKICANYKENTNCVMCKCELEEYELDLNTTLARSMNVLKYDCFFERMKEGIKMECMG